MKEDFLDGFCESCSLFEAASYIAFGTTERKTSSFYKENEAQLEKAKDALVYSIKVGNVRAAGTNSYNEEVDIKNFNEISIDIYSNTFSGFRSNESLYHLTDVRIAFEDLKKDFGNEQQKPSKFYTLSIDDSKLCLSDGTLNVILLKFQNNSKKFKVFSYIMSHPDRDILLQEIEEHIGETLKDEHLSTYVSNLYATDQNIMRLFFPSKSVNNVYFKSTVTDLDVNKMQHSTPNIDK